MDEAGFAAVDAVFTALPGVADPLTLASRPVPVLCVLAAIAAVALRAKRPRIALLAALGPVVTVALNTWALKPLIDRTHDGKLAFPSGHTATLVSVLAVLTLAIAAHAPPGKRRAHTAVAAATALALTAIAVSAIIRLRYHYLTDTIGAVFWAVGAVLAVAALIDWFARRRQPVGDARSVAKTPVNAVE